MKTAKSLNITIFSLVCFAIPVIGHCQRYALSTSSGGLTMGVTDLNAFTGMGVTTNGITLNLTITEAVYLDLTARTIRQAGVISTPPTNVTFVLQETQLTSPGVTNTGEITVTVGPATTEWSFDTGVQTMDDSDGVWILNDVPYISLPLAFVGSYSLITGGQTLTGSFAYTLSPFSCYGSCPLSVFYQFYAYDYPTTILAEDNCILCWADRADIGACLRSGIFADVTATNGFHMQLNAGSYYFVVGGHTSDFWGELWEWYPTAANATVTGDLPPTISAQPVSVLADACDTVSLSVIPSGALPIYYQWSLNGTNILGGTDSTLTIPSLAQTNLGDYVVALTNEFGSVTSSNAVLSMYPFIEAPFAGAITYWGHTNTLSVGAWGTGPLYYQWYQNGMAIQDATNQDLTLTSIQATNAGLYSVVVSSPLGIVTNPPAQVVVQPAGVSLGFSPTITINGVVGYSYIIQSRANLTDTNSWITLTNLTLTQPVQIYVDTNVDASSPFSSKHYYRVLPGQ